MNLKDLETGEHLIKDGNICMLTFIKDKDEKDDLSKGEFIVRDNKLYQATPVTNIKDCIEKKKRLRPEYKKLIINAFGNAIEYLSRNDYKVYFLDENKRDIFIVKKFAGNQMLGTKTISRTKKGNKIYFRKHKCYVPSGNFMFYTKLSTNNTILSYQVYLMPIDCDPISAFKEHKTNFYEYIHPHQHTGLSSSLCSGIKMDTAKPIFNVDYVITIIDATINGNPDGRSGLFNYNKRNPCVKIGNCHYGKIAYDLHKKGLYDLDIIKQIRIKRGEI